MKKFAFLFVAVSALSFASCGNKTATAEEPIDSVEVEEVDSCCADTCCADSCCADTVVAE